VEARSVTASPHALLTSADPSGGVTSAYTRRLHRTHCYLDHTLILIGLLHPHPRKCMRRLLFHTRIRAMLLFMNTRIRVMLLFLHPRLVHLPTSQLLRLVSVMHYLHIAALHTVHLLTLMQDCPLFSLLLFCRAIVRPLHSLFQVKIVPLHLQYVSA
jgi:hypothetical protein